MSIERRFPARTEPGKTGPVEGNRVRLRRSSFNRMAACPVHRRPARMRRSPEIGFTLVELMIVVAILTVLVAVAGTAYRKYMDAGRTAEVYGMLGEFRAKEEAYRAENGVYLSTSTTGETDFYPALLGSGEP